MSLAFIATSWHIGVQVAFSANDIKSNSNALEDDFALVDEAHERRRSVQKGNSPSPLRNRKELSTANPENMEASTDAASSGKALN